MKLNTKKLAVMTIFAALYAVGVISLALHKLQYCPSKNCRCNVATVNDFRFPSAMGFSLGCVVANVYGGLGVIDIVGGAAANFVACTLAWYIGRRGGRSWRFAGTLAETAAVTLIVGGYLAVLFGVPIEVGMLGILVGSVIAINIMGFPVQEAIRRSKIFKNYS